jgi:hypothetical protein
LTPRAASWTFDPEVESVKTGMICTISRSGGLLSRVARGERGLEAHPDNWDRCPRISRETLADELARGRFLV